VHTVHLSLCGRARNRLPYSGLSMLTQIRTYARNTGNNSAPPLQAVVARSRVPSAKFLIFADHQTKTLAIRVLTGAAGGSAGTIAEPASPQRIRLNRCPLAALCDCRGTEWRVLKSYFNAGCDPPKYSSATRFASGRGSYSARLLSTAMVT
jgi:hypothetical protein